MILERFCTDACVAGLETVFESLRRDQQVTLHLHKCNE